MTYQNHCSICNSKNIFKIHDTIREFKKDVLKCSTCDIVFLNNYKSINYQEDYGTRLFDDSWDIDKKIKERSKSLKEITNKIDNIIKKNNYRDILELGAGYGSTLIDLINKNKEKNFSCLEQNQDYISLIKSKTNSKVYLDLKKINKKFDIIYAIHFIEHIEKPISFLKDIKKILKRNGILFLVTPNHDDFYMNTLPNKNLRKYKNFIYHAAHPYYYNIISLDYVLNKSGFKSNSISTDQDYSITNFINWFSYGEPSKNISSAKKINKKMIDLDKLFKSLLNKRNFGSNLWSTSFIK